MKNDTLALEINALFSGDFPEKNRKILDRTAARHFFMTEEANSEGAKARSQTLGLGIVKVFYLSCISCISWSSTE